MSMPNYVVNEYIKWLDTRDDLNRLIPNVALHNLYNKYRNHVATDEEIAQLNRFAMIYIGQPALYEQFVEEEFEGQEPICTMNKVPYLTIQDAIDCAGSLPSTIYVTRDSEEEESDTINTYDKNITLELNNHNITASNQVGCHGGYLCINNGTITITGREKGVGSFGGGNLVLNNVTIPNCDVIGSISYSINEVTRFILNRCNITANSINMSINWDDYSDIESWDGCIKITGGTYDIQGWYIDPSELQAKVNEGTVIFVDESSVFPNDNKYDYLSPEEENYFYVENPGDESIDCIVNYVDRQSQSTPEFMNIEVSNDKETWTSLEFTLDPESSDPVIYNSITPIAAGEKLYIRCITDAWILPDDKVMYCIRPNGEFNVGGNIMSLLYGEGFEGATTLESNYTFAGLFTGSAVVNASELILPATTLTEGCYNSMFYDCTSLTAAPELPAQNLANNCYNAVFYGCTSLTTAPELPATTLAEDCYVNMFNGCTSLSEVTSYAQSVNIMALENWLDNVAQTGTFYNLGGATYEQYSVSGIPTGWTEETEKPSNDK